MTECKNISGANNKHMMHSIINSKSSAARANALMIESHN